jgi:hypothetical protein
MLKAIFRSVEPTRTAECSLDVFPFNARVGSCVFRLPALRPDRHLEAARHAHALGCDLRVLVSPLGRPLSREAHNRPKNERPHAPYDGWASPCPPVIARWPPVPNWMRRGLASSAFGNTSRSTPSSKVASLGSAV